MRSRTVDTNASRVVIPVIGTDERNNNYHLAMKSALQNHLIRFPVDEMTAKDDLIDKGVYQTMSANEKMRTLLGHVQLDIMIIDEAIKLQQVIKKGFLLWLLVETRETESLLVSMLIISSILKS